MSKMLKIFEAVGVAVTHWVELFCQKQNSLKV